MGLFCFFVFSDCVQMFQISCLVFFFLNYVPVKETNDAFLMSLWGSGIPGVTWFYFNKNQSISIYNWVLFTITFIFLFARKLKNLIMLFNVYEIICLNKSWPVIWVDWVFQKQCFCAIFLTWTVIFSIVVLVCWNKSKSLKVLRTLTSLKQMLLTFILYLQAKNTTFNVH